MGRKSKKKRREELLSQLEELERRRLELVNFDPYWYYEPSVGETSEAGWNFLRDWLKEEDIPLILGNQLEGHLSEADIIAVGGGNQCLCRDSLVETPKGKERVGDLYDKGESFAVYAWDGKRKVIAKAQAPYKKGGLHRCFRIHMKDGQTLDVGQGHRILTDDGFLSVSQLLPVFSRSLRATNLVFGLLTRVLNVLHWNRKERDFQCDYRGYCRLYGEQPLYALNIDQGVFPSQGGVPEHTELAFWHLGGLASRCIDNPYLSLLHLSSQGVRGQNEGPGVETLCRTYDNILLFFLRVFQLFRKPHSDATFEPQLNPEVAQHQSFVFDSFLSPPFCSGGNKVDYIALINSCQEIYDFEVEKHHNYFACDLVNHNSGKSVFGAIENYIQITKELPYFLRGKYPEGKIIDKSPVSCRVVGVDYKTMLNTLVPTYQKWVPRSYLRGGKWKNSWSSEQNKLFVEKAGKLYGTIEFMTNKMDVESFQGPPLDMVTYDEEPRRDIRKENLLRFTTSEKLREIYAMTPTKGLTWIKDDVFDKVEDESGNSVETFRFCSVSNKYANLKVLNEILKGMDTYNEIRMRLLGDFISLSGFVYGKLFSRKIHVIDPFPITKDYIIYRGIDPHLVKPSVCVEIAVDREENEYVLGVYSKDTDTEEIKKDLAERVKARGYRIGWTMCDKSADSTIHVLGDRNIFRELATGKNAIPALFASTKYTGSINAGVDDIKKKLKPDEKTGKPKLYFFNTPENRLIIKAMETLERDMGNNEDLKGVRDKINEGKHDAHACLRYAHQRPMRWMPPVEEIPEYVPDNETVNY